MNSAATPVSSRLSAFLLRSVSLLIWLICLILAQPFAAVAQSNEPPLPPAAQEAVNKGVLAAKIPDYLLAIRYFEEARKLAPEAPVIYLNMGLAESRIPGRELRSIAWFGAYLAAYPDAPNAAAVKAEIEVLSVRSQSNVSRLIKSVQDAASQVDNTIFSSLSRVPELWATAGDISAALKTADLLESEIHKGSALQDIAAAQVTAGDFDGAQNTADLMRAFDKSLALIRIVEGQVNNGDIAGAQKTADLIQDGFYKDWGQEIIAVAQAKSGDIAGAQKTAALIQRARGKSDAQRKIAAAQAKAGDIADAQKTFVEAGKTAERIQNVDKKGSAQKAIAEAQATAGIPEAPTADWLKKLDDGNNGNDCPLNTRPFLDLTGYLKSLPPSDNPQKVFDSLHETARKIVKAQNVITRMLEQEARK